MAKVRGESCGLLFGRGKSLDKSRKIMYHETENKRGVEI